MAGPRAAGLVQAVLRCYPARWRRRHGEEAAELAALLMRDGTPAASIAWSYLKGATRERLSVRLRPCGRLGTVVGALLAAATSLGVSLALVFASAPAKAASTARPGSGAHCQIGQAGTVKRKTTPAGNPRPQTWETGHGRSC